MHSKQVSSRWWNIPIHATVIIILRAIGKKEGEIGRQKPGKEQTETRSNGNQSNLRGLGGERGRDKNEKSVRQRHEENKQSDRAGVTLELKYCEKADVQEQLMTGQRVVGVLVYLDYGKTKTVCI